MGVLGVTRLFACKALWWTGVESAGRCLLNALESPQQDVRTVAGMFLVQAGKRAVPMVKQALQQGRYLPTLLTIAADIGARDLAPQIERFTAHSDPKVARAAREALDVLQDKAASRTG
jgi:hypothetical protein